MLSFYAKKEDAFVKKLMRMCDYTHMQNNLSSLKYHSTNDDNNERLSSKAELGDGMR